MLSEQDKVRVRHHMGYLNVQEAQTFVLGVPAGVQTQFMIEGAMTRLLPAAEPLVRVLLERMDMLEQQLVDDAPNLAASKIGEIEVRPDERKEVVALYNRWQAELGNMFGCIPNPFDFRSSGGINCPVM